MPLLLNLLPARFLLTLREWFDYKISHCVIHEHLKKMHKEIRILRQNKKKMLTKEEIANQRKISKLVKEYTKFKKDNLRILKFNPLRKSSFFGELWMFLFLSNLSYELRWRGFGIFFETSADLLRHGHLRRHRERQEDQVQRPTESDWRHHGAPHWVLHHQWHWNCFIRFQMD